MRLLASARLMRVSDRAVHLYVPREWIIYAGIAACWLLAGTVGPSLLLTIV